MQRIQKGGYEPPATHARHGSGSDECFHRAGESAASGTGAFKSNPKVIIHPNLYSRSQRTEQCQAQKHRPASTEDIGEPAYTLNNLSRLGPI
jgi:hypothetical protein